MGRAFFCIYHSSSRKCLFIFVVYESAVGLLPLLLDERFLAVDNVDALARVRHLLTVQVVDDGFTCVFCIFINDSDASRHVFFIVKGKLTGVIRCRIWEILNEHGMGQE